MCHVVDTCDYCAETGEALAELISDKMDPALRDGVDMTKQVDRFHDVTAKGLQILVSGLESRVDAFLRKMPNMSWDRSVRRPVARVRPACLVGVSAAPSHPPPPFPPCCHTPQARDRWGGESLRPLHS